MSVDSFYQIVSGVCFALCGLWWTVVQDNERWRSDAQMRGLAGGVYTSFLIPGAMSLGAQIGGDNKLVWRSVFVIAALLGMFFTARLLTRLKSLNNPGFFTRSRWLVIAVYLVVLVFALFPELAGPSGLKPIQVEAFLVCALILVGHGLAWELMTTG